MNTEKINRTVDAEKVKYRVDGFWSFFAAVKERDDLYQELLDWLLENKIQIPLDLNKKIQKAYMRIDESMLHIFDVSGKDARDD